MAKRLPLFMAVMGAARGQRLTLGDKLVLVYLTWRQGRNGDSWPSLKTIETDLHIGRRTCLRAISHLCESGCLQKTSGRAGRGHSNHYVILTEKRSQDATPLTEEKGATETPFDTRKGSKLALEKVAGCALKDTEKESSANPPVLEAGGDEQTPQVRTKKHRAAKPFAPPTADQVADHAESLGDSQFDADSFIGWYEGRGWKHKDGKPMKDWKRTVADWIKRDNKRRVERGEPPHDGFSQFNTHPATEKEITELEKIGVL